MARRSDHTRDEIKEMAISAGQEIISEEGFSGLSARKVAKKIGYTVGTIYNVFASHEELILYINAATLDDMYEFVSKSANKSPIDCDAIKNLAGSYIKFSNENYNRWSALFEFNLPQNIILPDWYSDKIGALFVLVEKPLGENKDAHRHAKVLWAGIHGVCQLGLTGKLDVVGAESVQVLTDSLIDNYMRGIK